MERLSQASRWQRADIGPESWHDTGIAWDSQQLVDLAVLVTTSTSSSLLAPELMHRIVADDFLRSWES